MRRRAHIQYHDLVLNAVTDSTSKTTQGFQGKTIVSTGQYDEALHGTSLDAANGVAISAGHNLTTVAANVTSENGGITLAAANDIHLNAGQENHSAFQKTKTHSGGLLSSTTTTTHDATQDSLVVGTQLSGSHLSIAAGNDLNAQAAYLHADNAIALAAGHDIQLTDAHDLHSEQHDTETKRFSFFSASSKRFGSVDPEWRSNASSTQITQSSSVGSVLSGDSVTVAAGHNLSTTNAQIVATNDVVLAAGHDLTLNAGQDTYDDVQGNRTSHTGLMNNGGLSVLIGNRSTQDTTRVHDVSYSGSTVGSLSGNVTLSAGNDVHITGSDVLSQTGTAIVGKNVTIDAAVGTTDISESHKVSQAGINVGIGGAAAQAANAAYYGAQRGSQVQDSRLSALYTAQAAYQASDALGAAKGGLSQNGTDGGINLQIGLGGSSASSTTTSHDETAYGSRILSQGNVTIAATGGDLNLIGSQISGDHVALAAANHLNLLSQAEHHTLQNNNQNLSGGVGLQIGTDGFGVYAQAAVGKGSAHGNGITHTDSTVNANGTLTLISGNDTTIRGAQLTGNQVIAAIGHNLLIQSEQDTDDYASKQWQANAKVVIGMGGGGSGSVGYNQSNMNSHYASVTNVSGINAGSGGFDITVGGNTNLVGGVIASSADPTKNILDTGSLTYASVHNETNYNASSFGVGNSLGLSVPQKGNSGSDTNAGIAQGTINVRDGNAELSGLDRSPTLDSHALKPIFDAQKVQEKMELGSAAGYVGMRAAGSIANDMANHATTDADKASWSDGGTNKILLHGLVGAATAALGGGDALQGALGATASEATSKAMSDYLASQGIDPYSQEGKALMALASAAVGSAVGGGSGAATALQGEQFNRQLHETEKERIKQLAGGDPQKEADLSAAACALVHCSAEYAVGTPEYAYYSQLEAKGNQPQYADDRALLQQQTFTNYITMKDGAQVPMEQSLFTYSWTDQTSDYLTWVNNSYGQPFTRLGGTLQAAGGIAATATGGSLAVGGGISCAGTGVGCIAAVGGTLLTGWGLDQTQAGGLTMWNGVPAQTFGGQLIQDAFGVSPAAAELMYGALGGIGASYASSSAALANIAGDSPNFNLLLKSGGVFGRNGEPLMDFSPLTNDQKRVVGELFGESGVNSWLPDAQKIARAQSTGSNGIDDLYRVNRPDVDYVIVEYKFGTSKLGATADGPQLSDGWTLGSNRLLNAVGNDRIASDVGDALRSGRVERWVVHTDPSGGVSVGMYDSSGKFIPQPTSKLLGVQWQ